MDRRKANLDDPKSIDEARQRAIEVESELAALYALLATRFYFYDDGMPFTPEDEAQQRRRIRGAIQWWEREKSVVSAYIARYEKEIRAEEEEDRQRLAREAKVRVAEEKRKKVEAYNQEQERQRQWKEQMIAQYGTAQPSRDIVRARQIELEKLQAERRREVLAMREKSQRLQKRKAAHKEWLALLEMDDSVDALDPENLLRHTYRVLRQIIRDGRATLTEKEKTVLDVISQRHLILADLEETT